MRLTVVLLAAGMVLVFAGTWAQIDKGIWAVQKEYFHSFIVPPQRVSLNGFHFYTPPLPGGLVIGGLMLVNLLAAHVVRFKLGWKRSGIILIHSGIILLLVGELVTTFYAVEMQMRVSEGETVHYAQDIREPELVIIDPSDPGHDRVTAIPGSRLINGRTIHDPLLPFDVRVERYFLNSTVLGPKQAEADPGAVRLADSGFGVRLAAVELPDEANAEQVNIPTAFVTLATTGKDARRLGTYMVSVHFDSEMEPDRVTVEGKTYLLALRFRRYYKDYSVHLIKFTHEKYAGTETPKNFSSQIRLEDPRHNESRDVLIYMNNPLRYDGETFYQSGFGQDGKTTVLQVVRNPGAWLPYVSCTMVAAGMLVHFGLHLARFLRGRFA
ncbi:MAG: cytochrome c biogenesis protein ResB [Planctomycetes bacterium]|nr:cytochrome c biogenesis protein ResB [Planctomycetota bacterium]